MCTVLLPPGVNAIAVNKYININQYQLVIRRETLRMRISRIPSRDHLRGGGLYASDDEIFRTSLSVLRLLSSRVYGHTHVFMAWCLVRHRHKRPPLLQPHLPQ
jgi:hypothetical protein